MNKTYRLSLLNAFVKSILGLVLSIILAFVILIFTYSFFTSILKSLFITDINLLFLIPLTFIGLVLFTLWSGLYVMKTVEIDKTGVMFRNWFTSKSFVWKNLRSLKVEPYNAFRTINPGSAIGVAVIRIFNPNYGSGEYLILKDKDGKTYKFFVSEYANSNALINDIKQMSK